MGQAAVGPAAAGRWGALRNAKRLLAAGVLLGRLFPLVASAIVTARSAAERPWRPPPAGRNETIPPSAG